MTTNQQTIHRQNYTRLNNAIEGIVLTQDDKRFMTTVIDRPKAQFYQAVKQHLGIKA